MVDEVRVLRLLRSLADDVSVLRSEADAKDERRADQMWLRRRHCRSSALSSELRVVPDWYYAWYGYEPAAKSRGGRGGAHGGAPFRPVAAGRHQSRGQPLPLASAGT